MKRLFLAPVVASLLISCFNGIIETETPGTPKIESSRILGYDSSSGGYVEKHTFHNSWDNIDWPYLEFIIYDDDLDINKVTITLINDTYPDGKKDFNFDLYQYANPQTCIHSITLTQGGTMDQGNLWYLQFFVTDKNGKRSKIHESDKFIVLSY